MKSFLALLTISSTLICSLAAAQVHMLIYPQPGNLIYTTTNVKIQKATLAFDGVQEFGVTLNKKTGYLINAIQQTPQVAYELVFANETVQLEVVSKKTVSCGSTQVELVSAPNSQNILIRATLLDHTTRNCRDLLKHLLIFSAEASLLSPDEAYSAAIPAGELKFRANPAFIYYIQN